MHTSNIEIYEDIYGWNKLMASYPADMFAWAKYQPMGAGVTYVTSSRICWDRAHSFRYKSECYMVLFNISYTLT